MRSVGTVNKLTYIKCSSLYIMPKDEGKSFLRKMFTVVTSPIWVPVAAVGGVVYGVGKGLDQSNDACKEDGALAGIAQAPVITVARTVAGPFEGIAKVGESMWDD